MTYTHATPGGGPEIRVGVIGLGAMGARYARMLLAGRVPRARLTAVCNRRSAPCAAFPGIPAFAESRALIGSGLADAVVVATPHYAHPDIGIDALEHGLHLLVDKPIAAHKADAERLIAAHRDPRLIFAAMFQMRADPRFVWLRDRIRDGSLGAVMRFQWTVTDWFRPDGYYRSGGWRATWAGEGGGVLLNQAPHQLDLVQWLFGLPARVRAWCRLGRYHAIEVEDDVTAYLDYADGASGVFLASTGEAPGTNRLEIAAESGRVVLEGRTIAWDQTSQPVSRLRREAQDMFARPPVIRREETLAEPDPDRDRLAVLANFADAILDGAPLLAPGAEGLASLELANAMLMSSLEERTVDLPLDAARYAALLNRLRAQPSPSTSGRDTRPS